MYQCGGNEQDMIDFALSQFPFDCKRGDWYMPYLRDNCGDIEAGDMVWVEDGGYCNWEDVTTEDVGTPMKDFCIVVRKKSSVLSVKENPTFPNFKE